MTLWRKVVRVIKCVVPRRRQNAMPDVRTTWDQRIDAHTRAVCGHPGDGADRWRVRPDWKERWDDR